MIAKYFNELVIYLIDKNIEKAIDIYTNYIGSKFLYLFLVYYILTKEETFKQLFFILATEKTNSHDNLKIYFTLASNKLTNKKFNNIIQLTDDLVYTNIFKILNYNKVKEEYELYKSVDEFIEIRDVYFFKLLNLDINIFTHEKNKLKIESNVIRFNIGHIIL